MRYIKHFALHACEIPFWKPQQNLTQQKFEVIDLPTLRTATSRIEEHHQKESTECLFVIVSIIHQTILNQISKCFTNSNAVCLGQNYSPKLALICWCRTQMTAYIYCFKMLVMVGEQNTKFWYYFNIILKWLDHKKQLAKPHASLQIHYWQNTFCCQVTFGCNKKPNINTKYD